MFSFEGRAKWDAWNAKKGPWRFAALSRPSSSSSSSSLVVARLADRLAPSPALPRCPAGLSSEDAMRAYIAEVDAQKAEFA